MELKDLVSLSQEQYKDLKHRVSEELESFRKQYKFQEWYRLTIIMSVLEKIYEPEHEGMF